MSLTGRTAVMLEGRSPAMRSVRVQIERVASRTCSVLLHGESGSGKELAARDIHALSPRAAQPFVAVDCTTLSEGIFESQLFGHVRGAFTGADRESIGFVRTADRGVLFLDEIGDLPLGGQAKLLRLLQERVIVPVGGTKEIPVDVRVIAATHHDLGEMVKRSAFREDLYYRLNVVRLELPPLRSRSEDIEPLLRRFLKEFAGPGEEPKALTPDAWDMVRRCTWPGNVRELRNAAEAMSVLCVGPVVDVPDLTGQILTRSDDGSNAERGGIATVVLPRLNLDETVRAATTLALKLSGGNQLKAAEMLGIDRKTLARKIQKYSINRSEL